MDQMVELLPRKNEVRIQFLVTHTHTHTHTQIVLKKRDGILELKDLTL
jgi:hypothetical protein